MDSIQIPEKTYFKIGEVAKLLDLQPYVLRYWETEFDALAPEKTRSGQRSYRRDDIELLLLIKTLLYDEMYTIAGARRQLKLRKKGQLEVMEPEAVQRVVSERDALRTERDTFLEVRERLEKAAEKLRHEASRLQLQNETLEDENAQLAAAQLEYESSIRRLRDELDARRETVRSLEDSNQSLSQKLDEAAERLDEQNGQLEIVADSGVDAAELEQMQGERDALQARVDDLQTQLQVTREELTTAREALATAVAESDAQRAALETKIGELNERVEYDALAREELEADLASLDEQLTASSQQLAALQAEKDRLLMEAADTAAMDALERQLSETATRAEKQRTHWVTMRRELETLASLVN